MTHPIALGDLPSDDDFGDWLDGLLPDDGSNAHDLVAMLTAMVDESGTHQNAKVLCVAAVLGMPHQWKAFRKAWRPIIADLRKPYHATQHKKNPNLINEQLAGLIERWLEMSVAVTIEYEDYKAVTTPHFRSLLGGAYSVATMQAMFEIAYYCKISKVRWVAYVFEKGHRNESGLKRLLDTYTNRPSERRPHRVYSQTWLTKEELALHPPDLVAFEVARSYESGLHTPIRTQLDYQLFHHHLTRPEIKEIVDVTAKKRRRR